MATLKKTLVVALAAVVALVSSFAQVSYAQAVPQPVSVLPGGEELPDEKLLEVQGEVWWLGVLFWDLVIGALTGWVVYQETGDILKAATWGVYAMTIATIGWGVGWNILPY